MSAVERKPHFRSFVCLQPLSNEHEAVLLASVSKRVLCATRRRIIPRQQIWAEPGSRGEKPPCADRRGNREEATMNILLWVLQVLAALLYGSSGIMKVFMFDKVSQDVPSFGALPRKAWMTLGILELVCTVGLIVPAAFHWQPPLTVLAATVLAVE